MDKSSSRPIETMVIDRTVVNTVKAVIKRFGNVTGTEFNNGEGYSKVVDEFGRTIFDYSGRWGLLDQPLSSNTQPTPAKYILKSIEDIVDLARGGKYFYIHDAVNVHTKPRTTALFLSPRIKFISSFDNISEELVLYFVSSKIQLEMTGFDSFRQTSANSLTYWHMSGFMTGYSNDVIFGIIDAIIAELDYVTLSLSEFTRKYRGLNVNFEPSVDAFGQIKIEVFVDESCVSNLSEGFTSENIELVTSRMSEISAWLGKSCNDRRVDPELFRAALEDFKSTEEKLLRLFTEGFMDNPS